MWWGVDRLAPVLLDRRESTPRMYNLIEVDANRHAPAYLHDSSPGPECLSDLCDVVGTGSARRPQRSLRIYARSACSEPDR